MASILKVDTITGVSTAGSIAVTGEGNSTTTNLQQGLAKSWSFIEGDGTPTLTDSFNVTSITDNETGVTTASFVNNMSNATYSNLGMPQDNAEIIVMQEITSVGRATTHMVLKTHNLSGSNDSQGRSYALLGDLA